MSSIERPYVLAAAEVQSVELINGGNTLAVRLHAADGDETCVLLPLGVVGELLSKIADALDVSFDQAS